MIAKDKILHFGGCFVLSFIITLVAPINCNKLLAGSFTEGLAIGKEVGDFMNYGKEVGYKEFAKMSAGDLVADNLGIVAGISLANLIKQNIGA